MTKETMTKKVGFSLSAAAAGKNPVAETSVPVKKENTGTDKDYERFNFICSKELTSKARAISRKEGFTIRALMEKAMTDFFEKYEVKNGPVGELISKDINDVL
jgi:hypothetical protein